MAKVVEAAIEELAKCLYDVSPISMEFDGVWRQVRFFELHQNYRQILYEQAKAAFVFMAIGQYGAGQNAEKQAQI